MKYNKIIFVSTDDTCRGPWAAGIMKKISGIDAESRGIISLFQEPANPRAVAVAKDNDVDIADYMSRQLGFNDFSADTLILVMSESMKKKIYEDFVEAENVYTIKEIGGETGDVDEVYGCELSEYGMNFEKMEIVVKKVVEKLNMNFNN